MTHRNLNTPEAPCTSGAILRSIGFLLPVLLFFITACTTAPKHLNLSGEWQFQTDPEDVGLEEGWYDRGLSDAIQLPGSLASNDKGFQVGYDTEFTGGIWINRGGEPYVWYEDPNYAPYLDDEKFRYPFWLIAEKYYTGPAWYSREVEVPKNWQDKIVQLFLERPHWETRVWVDDREAGMQNSLGTPHMYDMGRLTPGKHRITVRIDNRIREIEPGQDAHSVSDNTQSNWNGIVGAIRLEASDPVSIVGVQVFPDVEHRMAMVEVTLDNSTDVIQEGRLRLMAESRNAASLHSANPIEVDFTIPDTQAVYTFEYPMGEGVLLWDEFAPNLYALTVELEAGKYRDTHEVTFGMRDFRVEGSRFTINGRPVFLRGTLECAIFPETGYPPTDEASWERIFDICRAHGLNHMRFHSWCPPEAAFAAADKKGFYLQAEASVWTHVGNGAPVDQWLYDETARMIKAYGNHPSFCMMAHGNEPHGPNRDAYLSTYVDYWKGKDSRRVYTAGAGWPMIEANEYHSSASGVRIQGWGQELNSIINSQPPATDYDWSAVTSNLDKPMVSHEIGQWCVYPDLKETEKYSDDILRPTNFEIFRKSLEAHHMLHLADSFLLASGKLQALCYKADIEAALRTPGFAGFQLLDLHDFPGQGTALVGVLNAHWDEKGYITPEEFRTFCNSTVPLLRIKKRIFTETESLEAGVEVAHFGPVPMKQVETRWKIMEGELTVAEGSLGSKDISLGNAIPLGTVRYTFSREDRPRRVTLSVEAGDHENSWDLWVYPEENSTVPAGVMVAERLDASTQKLLNEGGTVLLSLGKGKVAPEMGGDVGVGFSSIFWNTAWTNNQKPHTLGILCDPSHPSLQLFPTDYHSNWQWWDAMSHADAICLDSFSPELKPLVRIIDDWVTNRRLALLFEARVGNGKVVVSGTDLVNDLADRPEARQLRASLLGYMASEEFDPSFRLEMEDLTSIPK
jgi:hypothetical protein